MQMLYSNKVIEKVGKSSSPPSSGIHLVKYHLVSGDNCGLCSAFHLTIKAHTNPPSPDCMFIFIGESIPLVNK